MFAYLNGHLCHLPSNNLPSRIPASSDSSDTIYNISSTVSKSINTDTSSLASIHPADRGFLLGDGLFETLRADQGQLAQFDAHHQRLQRSAHALAIPLPQRHDELKAACLSLLKANQLTSHTAALRITLTRGLSHRGLTVDPHALPTCLITAIPYAPPSLDQYPRCFITSIQRNPNGITTQHKTLNYLEPIMARYAAQQQGYDEGILCNLNGHLTECATANLFLIVNQTIITPPCEDGVFPGLMRQRVINLCRTHQLPFHYETLSPELVNDCDAAFQTNSLIGIQALSAINTHRLSPPNAVPLLRRLIQLTASHFAP